jgi:predicted esterase
MPPLEPIVVEPRGKHTATLIIAHGLGDTGSGWSFLAKHLTLKNKFGHVKFIFPTAPARKITIVRDRPKWAC